MFNNCLTGELKDKTRILVTNQLQFVSPADIAIFMANGKIAEIGTYAELMANGDQFASLMSQAEVPACFRPTANLCCAQIRQTLLLLIYMLAAWARPAACLARDCLCQN